MTPIRTTDLAQDDAPFTNRAVRWDVVAWILGIVVSVLVTYNATANNYDRRISILETKAEAQERRLQRIEDKIDILISQQSR